MKKLLVLLMAATLAPALCFAYVDENKTSDIDVLKSQGFSDSMLRTVDVVNDNNKGVSNDYVRRYAPKRRWTGPIGKSYEKVRLYVDPIQDDGMFGEHQVNFTNTWNNDKPTSYSSLLKEKETIEDL